MSGKVMGEVWELDLPFNESYVLLSLADHASHDGTRVFPGVALTAWKTSYSARNVQRILRKLEDRGLLVPVAHEEGGRGNATEYRIDLSAAPRKPPFEPKTEKGDNLSKGDKSALKGDTAMSPQPSENRQTTMEDGSPDGSPPPSGAGAPFELTPPPEPGPSPFAEVMGELRRLGFAMNDQDGSIVKALLGKGVRPDEIIYAARGLYLLRRDGRLADGYGIEGKDPLGMAILYHRPKKKEDGPARQKPMWREAEQRMAQHEQKEQARTSNTPGRVRIEVNSA